MSRKLVSFELTTKEVLYYSFLKITGKNIYDKPDHWPVEEYDDAEHKIVFETVEALIEDVLEFAGILQNYLLQAIESTEPKEGFAHLFKKESLQFVIEGTAEYTSSGENCRFRIELNDGNLTIQESENYIFFGSMYFENYEAFCATKTILCDDLSKLCSKDEFDGDCEYCVTHDKLYADEFPPYGKKIFADKYMKAGEVYSVDDVDATSTVIAKDKVKAQGNVENALKNDKKKQLHSDRIDLSGHYMQVNDYAEETGESCGVLIENQPLAEMIVDHVESFTFSEQQKKALQDGCFLYYSDECNICPSNVKDVLDRLSEILYSEDDALASDIENNKMLLEGSFKLVYWTRITFDMTDAPESLLNNMTEEVFEDYKESFLGLDFPKVPNVEQMSKMQLVNTSEFAEFMTEQLTNDSSNFRRREEFVYFAGKEYYREVLEYSGEKFPELYLKEIESQTNSDSGIKKKEQLRSKLEEHRINREKEENHVKEIIFSIITGDKKKTIAEMQKENRELSGMSAQRISGYLRRFVTSGELECMGNIYYMLPETAERIRTKEKKRQEEQQRQEEEKKKQEKEARREYERVKDSLKRAKAEKKQTEAGIEKIQAEISEIETELEKQNKKLLFKDKSLIDRLNTDLSEKRAKLKEVQGIKEQNSKALRTLEEELQSKYAPFVQEDEEKNKKEFAAKYPKIADFFQFEIEKRKSIVKQLLSIMKQNEQKEWNINELHNATDIPADERFKIVRGLDSLTEDGLLESNKKYNYKLRNVSDVDELLEKL
ncbi:MAG: hypothetical protein LUC95_02175 [Lachnospiraceae bacterium]|nr:hypothetical protein [Lachnospiraceae bacterium]